jgi:transcriptional regulator with XRE-family HTH domain
MMITDVNDRMLRAARSLTGLSQQQVVDLARISRPSVTAWENSSDGFPNANMYPFRRLVSALQAEESNFTRAASPSAQSVGVAPPALATVSPLSSPRVSTPRLEA